MKIKLDRSDRYNTIYKITDDSDREIVLGNASESYNKKYWVLQMDDNPVSMRFDKLSELTKYIISL